MTKNENIKMEDYIKSRRIQSDDSHMNWKKNMPTVVLHITFSQAFYVTQMTTTIVIVISTDQPIRS